MTDPRAEPEDALIERARGGDASAFGQLVERHRGAVFGLLLGLLRDWDSAEDAAQAAFVKAYRSLGSFEKRSSFKTWVCSIALNEGRGVLRWRKLRGWLPLGGGQEDDDGYETAAREAAAPDELAALERRLELERAMKGLGPREREIATMRLEGWALGEIAEALGVSEGTVKSTLFDATRKMREKLHGDR